MVKNYTNEWSMQAQDIKWYKVRGATWMQQRPSCSIKIRRSKWTRSIAAQLYKLTKFICNAKTTATTNVHIWTVKTEVHSNSKEMDKCNWTNYTNMLCSKVNQRHQQRQCLTPSMYKMMHDESDHTIWNRGNKTICKQSLYMDAVIQVRATISKQWWWAERTSDISKDECRFEVESNTMYNNALEHMMHMSSSMQHSTRHHYDTTYKPKWQLNKFCSDTKQVQQATSKSSQRSRNHEKWHGNFWEEPTEIAMSMLNKSK